MKPDNYVTDTTPYAKEAVKLWCEDAEVLRGFVEGLNYHKTIPATIKELANRVVQGMDHFYSLNKSISNDRDKCREKDKKLEDG